jgi:hypothetical protein
MKGHTYRKYFIEFQKISDTEKRTRRNKSSKVIQLADRRYDHLFNTDQKFGPSTGNE